MRVIQHLVGLQLIGDQGERPVLAQLELRYLQFRTHPVKHRPLFAPVKLERLTRAKP